MTEDVRFADFALEMYELVKEMARPEGKNCYLLEQQAKELLARIAGKDIGHDKQPSQQR